MAELAERLLLLIADKNEIESLAASKELNVDHEKIVGAIKSLHSLGDVSYSFGSPTELHIYKMMKSCAHV